MTLRRARADDEAALLEIDRATWSPEVTPTLSPPDGPFFRDRARPENVIVAEVDGQIAGYASMTRPTPLPRNDHVWEVSGVAVHPDFAGRGTGYALMEALIAEARERGARRVTLRVFASNQRAQRLYERLGFELEGVLRGEFRLGDRYVDDVLMALAL